MSELKFPPGRKFEIVSSAWLSKSLTAACASSPDTTSLEPVLLSQALLWSVPTQTPELVPPFHQQRVIVGEPPVQSNESSTSEFEPAVPPSPWRCGMSWLSGPPGAAWSLLSSTERLTEPEVPKRAKPRRRNRPG